jgi:Fic family protein
MRLPRRPPPLQPEHLGAVLGILAKPELKKFVSRANAEYFHWDELRARPRPPGLSLESAWAAVKTIRMAERRTLPLRDPKGKAFSYWLPPQALATLHDVDRWGGSTLALDDDALPDLQGMREQVIVSSLMEEAIATSQIEGAATTRRVAKEMLRTKRKARDRSEQMIINSYETIQFLREQKTRELSLDLLFEIQARMTLDTLDDPTAVGRFRTQKDEIAVVDVRDGAVIFTPPPAKLIPRRMEELVAFANAPNTADEFIHPLVKAAVLHFWLAYEHPYVDGNGRTARALFYWFMLKNGYWLFEFLTVSRAIMKSRMAYYRSFLYSEHDDEDMTYSLLFQLEATKYALGDLREHLREKQEEQRELARTLRAFPDLNRRQRTLVDHVLRVPGEVVTFQSHQRSHGITYVTARTDLLGLVRRGLVEETRQGKQRAFYATANLRTKLGRPASR